MDGSCFEVRRQRVPGHSCGGVSRSCQFLSGSDDATPARPVADMPAIWPRSMLLADTLLTGDQAWQPRSPDESRLFTGRGGVSKSITCRLRRTTRSLPRSARSNRGVAVKTSDSPCRPSIPRKAWTPPGRLSAVASLLS